MIGLFCQVEVLLVVDIIGILSALDLPVRAKVGSSPPTLFVRSEVADDAVAGDNW